MDTKIKVTNTYQSDLSKTECLNSFNDENYKSNTFLSYEFDDFLDLQYY